MFFQVLIGILAFCIAEGKPGLLMFTGTLAVIAWFMAERTKPLGLPRQALNLCAVAVVVLLTLEMRITDASQPVALVGHFVMALQIIILFGIKGRREYLHLAVLSPLQMLSASLLPGGVSLVYGLLLLAYCAIALMTTLAQQMKQTGEFIYDRHKRAAQGMGEPQRPELIGGEGQRTQRRLSTGMIGLTCGLIAIIVFIAWPRNDQKELAISLTRPNASRTTGFSNSVNLSGGNIAPGSPEPVLNLTLSRDTSLPGGGYEPWLIRGAPLDVYSRATRTWSRSYAASLNDVTLHQIPQGNRLVGEHSTSGIKAQITLRRLSEQNLFVPAPVHGPIAMTWFNAPTIGDVTFGCFDQRLLATTSISNVNTYELRFVTGQPIEFMAQYRALLPQADRLVLEHNESAIDTLPPKERERFSLRWEVERPRITQYAHQILERRGLPADLTDADADTRLAGADALADYLRLNFDYSIQNPKAGETDPIIDFLFNRRSGHCELFASALCAMCRCVGIPARITTGFRASEYNEIGGYYIVRQAHAHAWTEIELEPKGGWFTIDATPAEEVNRQHTTDAQWLTGLRSLYDHLEFRWISSVITYDQSSQQSMLGEMSSFITQGPDQWASRLGQWSDEVVKSTEIDTISYIAMALMALVLVLAIYSLLRLLVIRHRRMVALQLTALPRAQRRGLARQLRFYINMLEMLERHGYVRPHWQSPYSFAKQLASENPLQFDPVIALTELFYEIRFGYRPLDDTRSVRLKAHLKQLEHMLTLAAKPSRPINNP